MAENPTDEEEDENSSGSESSFSDDVRAENIEVGSLTDAAEVDEEGELIDECEWSHGNRLPWINSMGNFTFMALALHECIYSRLV